MRRVHRRVGHHRDKGFLNDTGMTQSAFEDYLFTRPWRLRKKSWFKRRLDHCLPGEICAFRQTVVIASKELSGVRGTPTDIIVYTDNSNVYHATKKGRSGSYSLNSLCKTILACELIYNVRIHSRWCSTHVMPADKYTRFIPGGTTDDADARLAGPVPPGEHFSK